MYKILRIVSCLLAVACAVVCIFVFVYFGWIWGIVCLLIGAIFAGLMFLFKSLQTKEELKANPPPPTPDFITGPIPPKEEEVAKPNLEEKDNN